MIMPVAQASTTQPQRAAQSSKDTCARCNLRLQRKRQPTQYTHPTPAQTSNPPSPCPACLGILEESSLGAVTRAVAKLQLPIIHARHLKIRASLPPAASLVRQRAFELACPPMSVPVVSLREAVKWALSDRLHKLGFQYAHDADLFLDLVYTHPETAHESDFVLDPHIKTTSPPLAKRPRTPHNSDSARRGAKPAEASISQIERVMETLSDHQFRRLVPIPPAPISTPVHVSATLSTAPVLIAGRYTKKSRIISQTPWFIHSRPNKSSTDDPDTRADEESPKRRTETSVEDVATRGIAAVLTPTAMTFTAGGREDVDVRMLASGRPFVVEVQNPSIVPSLITDEHVKNMVSLSNRPSAPVQLHDLRVVPRSYFTAMRDFETEKRKHYRCVVWTARPYQLPYLRDKLDTTQGFCLMQKTPLRVLHRRTQAVRERQVYETRVVRFVNDHFFVLDVVAQAGTYIKEFVHGDHGRTTPNVGSILGCDADILQLDVTQIQAHQM